MIHSNCNFHCLSYFATAFIAVGTKTSIVKIVFKFFVFSLNSHYQNKAFQTKYTNTLTCKKLICAVLVAYMRRAPCLIPLKLIIPFSY
ncbi:hypothetical protein PVVCY_0602350 [Plasmodium vinckei vinckei]|uniref:Uncharacterized protein n=1 Tax=Plasmodium vinckei vinckei TaxID=54757 RepID=A0A449BQ69_PLAVN|nr:hypothetical protein PVVCY_0602350 [Plasmodium vinckei vinckei]